MVAKDPVKDIEIKTGDKAGKQNVIFKSSNPNLTKEKLIAAIGSKKERYVVETVKTSES